MALSSVTLNKIKKDTEDKKKGIKTETSTTKGGTAAKAGAAASAVKETSKKETPKEESSQKSTGVSSVIQQKIAKDVENKKLGITDPTETGWKGYKRYLADQKKAANAKKEEEAEEKWWERMGRYLGSSPDSTLIGSNMTLATEALREDTSYKEPSDEWSDTQKNTFGLYYETKGKKAAEEYAVSVNNSINKAKKDEQRKAVTEKATSSLGQGALQTAGAVLTAPLGGADFLADLAESVARGQITERDGNLTPFEYSQAVTEGVSTHLNDRYGTLNEDIPIIGGKGLGDVYGLGTSIAQSSMAAYTGGAPTALISFFGSAAAAGVDDAKARGASDDQAISFGIMSGLAEAIPEAMGIDNLLKIGFSDTLKSLMKNILKQSGVEGIEEGATSIINNFADNLIMGDFSNFNILKGQYMAQGMSEEEAKKQAWIDTAEDIAFDSLAGFVSGGIHAGPQTAYQTIAENRNARNTYGESVNELIEEGLSTPAGTRSHELAQEYKEKIEDGKTLSGAEIRLMVEANEQQFTADDTAKIQEAAENRLRELGESDNVAAIAQILAKQAGGETITKAQQRTLDASTYGQRVSNELNPQNIQSGGYASDWTGNIGTQRINADLYNLARETAGANTAENAPRATQAEAGAEVTSSETSSTPKTETAVQSEFKVSDSGETFSNETGEKVNIAEVASIKNGKMTLKLESGEEVGAESISFGNQGEALVYETVAKLDNINASAANILVKNMDLSNVSPEIYAQGIKQAYRYGTYNIPVAEMMAEGSPAAELSEQQRMQAYKLGQSNHKAAIQAKEGPVRKNRTTEKKASKGKVHYDKTKAYNERQKVSIEALEKIADALGIEFHLFESPVVNGRRQGANGWIDSKGIHIDTFAGQNGEATMIFTAAHELAHFIKKWSPAKFDILADFLMEEYGKKGVSVDELVRAQQEKARRNGREISYDVAFEEVVADSMETMLSDGKVMEKLAKLKAKDQTLWEKIKSYIADLVKKIKEVYAGLKPNSAEGQYVAEMVDSIERLQELFTEGLIEASENFQTIGSIDFENFTEAKNTEGEQLFQYRAMEADEDSYRSMLKKWGKFSDAQINNLFTTIDKAMDVIKDNLEALDYAWEADINDRAFSPVKPNSDSLYQVSIDFSTLCRKRLLQQAVQAQLQEALMRPTTREEGIAIRDALMAVQEEGRQIEVACALCYVESARMKSPPQIEKFLESREAVIKDFFASKSGGNIKEKIQQAEAKAREELGVGDASLKALPKKVADQIRAAKKEAKASYTPTAEEQRLIDAANKMTVSDFTTPEGLENLAKHYRGLFDAYTSYVRNATKSKGIENDTWWRAGDSERIGDTLIANMNRENGLRSQSWSDFQVIHMMDYIAAVIELSTRNSKMQAYTKVPDYVELMGNTGVMINLSLIPARDYLGTLEYDSTEGIDYKKSLELRDKYHATAGTICIGVDNNQIKQLFEDMTIDYVIPYHKSGMAAHVRKAMHIPTWTEYEQYQSETNLSDAKAKENAERYGAELLDKSDPDYHKHTSFSEWFDLKEAQQIAKMENAHPSDPAKQKKYGVMYGGYMAMQNAANNYLKLCAERGLAPVFSHAKADFTGEDNYWKVLIDRKMVDNITGEIIEQKAIQPIFDEAEVLRILNDELERYPKVKADQEYAIRRVTEKFLSGEIKEGMSSDAIARAMQKPVDNISKTNIVEAAKDMNTDPDIRYQMREFDPSEKKIKQNINELAETASVYDVPKSKLSKTGKRPTEIFAEYFDMWGNNLYSDELGDIALRKSSIKSEIRHGITAEKIASIEAIPSVIKEGKIIFAETKKGSDVQRIVVGAPITIGGNPYYMGVMLQRDTQNQRLYLHNVVIEKEASEISQADLLTTGADENNEYLFITNIPQNALAVKYHNQNGAKKIVSNYPAGNVNTTGAGYRIADNEESIAPKKKDVKYSLREEAPTFYSYMGKVVDGIKTEKVGANGVIPYLKGKGVKDEEIKWSGIEAFLEGKKSLTKKELQEFVAGSTLQIGEQTSGNDIDLRYDGYNHYSLYDKDGNVVNTYTYNEFVGGYVSEADDEIYTDAIELEDAVRQEYGEMSSPRWADYKLYGGSNYREIVFIMPNSSYSNRAMKVHWGQDAEGILAHTRVQDFETDDGKMLFIEEIQSDWHNEGQRKGYTTKEYDEAVEKADKLYNEYIKIDQAFKKYVRSDEFHKDPEDVRNKKYNWLREKAKAAFDKQHEAERYVRSLEGKGMGDVPNAPFKNNYHEYVLKRLIREAAEKGYDSIGWTTAEVQSNRFSSDYAEGYRIEYDQDIPSFLKKYGKKWGAKVGKTIVDDVEVWSMQITDSMKESVLAEGQPLYQDRDTEGLSTRAILANAFESAAQNDIEKRYIQEYKDKIELINSEEAHLHEVNEQIKELSFAKGPKDTKKLKELHADATRTANRISTFDKQLLRLEASKPLKNVIDRERKMAFKRAQQKGKEAVAKARQRAAETQREIITRYQESRKKAVEGREKTALRHKIKGVVGELNQLLLHGTKDKHVMIGLQKAVAEALDAVNMDTIGAEERVAKYNELIAKANDPDVIASLTATRDRIQQQGDNLAEKIAQLKAAYGDIQNSDDPLVANGYDEVIASKIDAVVSTVGNTPLRAMSTEQLESVYDMYKMVLTRIRMANASFKMEKKEAISTLGNRVMMEVEQVGGKHPYRLKGADKIGSFSWNNEKPVYAFERIGSKTFAEVFDNVRAGEDTWAKDVEEAKNFFKQESRKYHYDKWDMKRTYSFKSKTGQSFKLTLPQIMSLYAYSKRKQADKHLELGGFVFDSNIEVVEKKNGIPVKYTVNTATSHQINREILGDIIGNLTAEQKAFVDEMQDYLSSTMGEKGNEVSLLMYGVKLFKEKFYFPLKSAKQFMFEQNQTAGEVRLKNSGFSKETVVNASNPVILANFMDVWGNHVNDMSMYHAFVLPLEDFNRVFSYKTPTTEGLDTESVKQFIQNAYGEEANTYLSELIKDLNGGARIDQTAGFMNKLIGGFKKASVFASASVVIQQPSAIVRAHAIIDSKYFLGLPKFQNHNKIWEEVKKYAPVAIIKEMGYFDTNMGRSTVDYIKDEKTLGSRADDFFSFAPAKADEVTWAAIWNAVKRETKAKNPSLNSKSEEFLQKVGKRFTEVVTKTQVYDSVLARSANMRSKDTGMKMVTAFMAEPTTSINMLEDAVRQWKRGHKKQAINTVSAVYGSVLLNAALVSLVYAARDDDEDENYLEKYIGSLATEIIDGINPLTYIPFIKDIWSIGQGFDVERADMSLATKLIEAFEKVTTTLAKDTSNMDEEELAEHNKEVNEAVLGIVDYTSALFGVPVKNLRRDLKAAENLYSTIVGRQKSSMGSIFDQVLVSSKNAIPVWGWFPDKSKGDKIYDAIIAGDKAYVERLKASYDSESGYGTALRKALRDNDSRIREAAQARIDGDPATYMKLAKEVIADGFSQDDVVKAINAEINALNKGETESSSASKATGFFKADDYISAIENRDQAAAQAIKNDIVATAIANGKDQDDAEKDFTSSFKSAVWDRYEEGELNESQVTDMLTNYADMEEAEVEIKFQVYEWKATVPGADDITASAIADYNEFAEPAGIGKADYYKAWRIYNDTDADIDPKTGEGIAYSKVKKVMPQIDALPLTAAQKTALARCWWAESTVRKYKTW